MDPQTYISPNNQPSSPSKWWQNRKLWIGLVGVIIFAEVVWSIYTLSKPLSQPAQKAPAFETEEVQTTVSPKSASFSLLGPVTTRIDETIKVDVHMDVSGAAADGLDLVIKYDPTALEVVNAQAPMVLGQAFPNYPDNSADLESGLITVSAVSTPDSPGFSGQTVLGSISFKAKKLGNTSLTLDYTKGSTKDSNIVETTTGDDILNKVTNLDIKISN